MYVEDNVVLLTEDDLKAIVRGGRFIDKGIEARLETKNDMLERLALKHVQAFKEEAGLSTARSTKLIVQVDELNLHPKEITVY